MKRQKCLLACLLWVMLAGACRPIVDPTAPTLQLLGHVAGPALAVAVQEEYAYLGFSYELVVLDIRDRTNPQWVTALPLPTNDLALAGAYAYVVGRGGFTVVDITDPTQPRLLGHLASQATAASVVVTAEAAYFTEGNHLHQVNITDPLQPVITFTHDLPARAARLATADHTLYASSWAGIQLFDLAAHDQPHAVCFVTTAADTSAVVTHKGSTFFVSNEQLFSVAGPLTADCAVRAQLPLPGTVFDLAVVDDLLYLANGSGGLRVWKITNPQAPVEIGAYSTQGIAIAVAVQDGMIYLVDCNDGLQILAADDPAHLTRIGAFTPLGAPDRMAVAGYYAYVAAGFTSNLHQIAVADPAQMHTAATHLTTEAVYGLALADNALYLMLEDGVQVIDLTVPTQPVLGNHYPLAAATSRRLLHIAVQDDHVYLGDSDGNVWLLDLAAPVQPIGTPTYTALGNVGAMSLTEDYAYVPYHGVGVRILAVADSGELTPVGLFAIPAPLYQTVVADGYLYLAAGRDGLFIVDVHEPTAPTLVRHYPMAGTAYDVTIVEHYALIAAGEAGLQVLDIRDPARPVAVAAFDTPDCAHAVVSSGGRIYLLDRWGGFYILTLTTP